MNPIETLRHILDTKKGSLRELASEMRVPYSSLHAFENYAAKSMSIELISKLDEYLTNQLTTTDIDPYLPRGIRREFEYICMHGISELNYQWAAFTEQPSFDPEKGVWSLPRLTGEQVNISNWLDLPYDSDGPNKAIYRRTEAGFKKIEAPQVKVKHPVVSEAPLREAVNAKFPRTDQKGGGLVAGSPRGEWNRR